MEYNFTYREKDKGIQLILNYKDHTGKWKQKSKQGFKNKKEARLYQDKLLEEAKKELALQTPRELEKITLGEFKTMFLESQNHLAGNTIKNYKVAFQKIKELDSLELKKINYLLLSPYLIQMKDALCPSSFVENIAKLRKMFNHAIRPYRIITENPLSDVEFPAVKKKDIVVLSRSEILVLLEKIKAHNRAYYTQAAIAAYCGLRFGEVLGLMWSDISMKERTIQIERQWALNDDMKPALVPLKSDNSYRTIPFPSALKPVLSDYKNQNPLSITGRIFKQRSTSSQRVNEIITKCGYPQVTLHTLRHSYATTLLAEGVDVKTVAALLGDTVETVIKTYIHYSDEMRENAKTKIEKIF